MKRNIWKKLFGILLLVGVLVFAFWYGGDAPGLRGFSVGMSSGDAADAENLDDKSGANDSLTSENDDNIKSNDESEGKAKNKNAGTGVSSNKKEKDVGVKGDKKKGFLEQIVMRVKKLGSSKRTVNKNPQLNKRAKKNANKATDNSLKKKKKNTSKKTVSKNTEEEKKNSSGVEKNNNSSSNDNVNNDNNANDSNNIDEGTTSTKTDNRNEDFDVARNSNVSGKNNGGSVSEDDDKSGGAYGENEQDSKNNVTKNDDADSNRSIITCKMFISCASVLDHMDKLSASTKKVIPEDGIILDMTEVKVKNDSSVFDVLQKAARENKIHLEYNYTPAYKTYYIEGIGNLYQFDAGNLSGWMYSVNDEFPGVGCSGYKVKDGDVIRFIYTCNFGKDVGGYVEVE